eukprot:767461-Hanusia_phi.AAC.2
MSLELSNSVSPRISTRPGDQEERGERYHERLSFRKDFHRLGHLPLLHNREGSKGRGGRQAGEVCCKGRRRGEKEDEEEMVGRGCDDERKWRVVLTVVSFVRLFHQ